MNQHLKAKIKQWCKDWDKTYPKNLQIDDDTFEGGAYYLLQEVLAKDIEKKIVDFFKLVVKGIRGEYEQGWSYRKPQRDIQTLKEILNS